MAYFCLAYELWFKQVLFEMDSVCEILLESVRAKIVTVRQEMLADTFCEK